MPTVKQPDCEPIPGYRLLEPLGSGGFGEVWKCEAPGGIHKAIKFVYGDRRGLQTDGVRAADELQAIQRIKSIRHPFLLSMDRVENVDDELLIIMELADHNLDEILTDYRTQGAPGIPRAELLGYLREAAEVLDLLNLKFDLQHLDIKPRNLFVVSHHIKVADFGLVSSLAAGEERGRIQLGAITPLYASPELFQGTISRQCDQYSLAIVFQELLTGKLPFTGKNARQLLVEHTKSSPDLSALPDEDRPIIGRALSKKPQERFPSCMDLIRALGGGQKPHAEVIREVLSNGPPPNAAATAETLNNLACDTETRQLRQAPNHPDGVLAGYVFLDHVAHAPHFDLWSVRNPQGCKRCVKFLYGFPGAKLDTFREAAAFLGSLNHPALIPNEIVYLEAGRIILLTDAVAKTIRERFQECRDHKLRGIPRHELLADIRAAAEVLDYLYQQHGISHLGLSPRNLTLENGWLQICDFGLAQLLWHPAGHDIAALNTRYSAPELFSRSISRQADQYSLALLYAELLTGVHPFGGEASSSKCNRAEPNLEGLSPSDRKVIARALEADPGKRWPSCTDMAMALDGSGVDTASQGRPESDPFIRLVHMPRLAPPIAIRGASPGNLRQMLMDIILGIGGKVDARALDDAPELSPDGSMITYRFHAGLPIGSARKKLENFHEQWSGRRIRDDDEGLLIDLDLPTAPWRRWFGKQPGLVLVVRLSRVSMRVTTPIDVNVQILVHGCKSAEGRKFLEDMGPLLLDGLRNRLLVNAEKRTQERIAWPHPVRITPITPDGEREDAVECRGKDISLGGLGFYVPHELTTTEVLIELPNPIHPPAILLPATLVRAASCADGWYDVGSLFRLPVLRQSSAELTLVKG